MVPGAGRTRAYAPAMAPPGTVRRGPTVSNHVLSPRARRLAGATVVLVLVAGGCSDDGDGDDQAADGRTTTTSTTEPAPTSTSSTTVVAATTPTTTATTTTTTASSTTSRPFEGGTEQVEIPLPATTQEVVSHTDLAVTSAGGEERIAFRFDGSLPGVVVEYVEPPVRKSGTGDEVAVEGAALLGIRFEPASSARIDGEDVTRTYTGPERVAGTGGAVAEVVQIGNFEAVYEWVAGLGQQVPFRVEVDEATATVTVVVPAP